MWKIAIFPVFLVAFLLIAYLAFYRGAYTAPVTPQVPVDEIVSVPSAGGAYTDLPVFEASPIAGSARGHLLIDAAHRNNMLHPELNVLLSRVSARGYSSSFFEAGSTVSLAEELSQADAFLVVLPADWFAPDEIEAVVKFVEEGGRVLLVGDPGASSTSTTWRNPWESSSGPTTCITSTSTILTSGRFSSAIFRLTPSPRA